MKVSTPDVVNLFLRNALTILPLSAALGLFCPLVSAQTLAAGSAPSLLANAGPVFSTSSSRTQTDAVDSVGARLLESADVDTPVAVGPSLPKTQSKSRIEDRRGRRPFSSLGIGLKIGVGGYGLDLATPIGPRMNLRVGGSYFSYDLNLLADHVHYTGNLELRRVNVAVDIFPFGDRGREGFRITPGVTVFNGNHAHAAASVEGGQNFNLNNQQYTSDPNDPVHGAAALDFGKGTAPSLTIGFGNIIPRSGAHWSFPVEIGFEYVSRVFVTLSLAGSACQADGCGPMQDDPETQSNVISEQQQLGNDLETLRFYPIASVGVAYRFGHHGH